MGIFSIHSMSSSSYTSSPYKVPSNSFSIQIASVKATIFSSIPVEKILNNKKEGQEGGFITPYSNAQILYQISIPCVCFFHMHQNLHIKCEDNPSFRSTSHRFKLFHPPTLHVLHLPQKPYGIFLEYHLHRGEWIEANDGKPPNP